MLLLFDAFTWRFTGALTRGDFLIVDNASIHFASSIRADLTDILASFGVQLRFLPAYSPELSPAELVFSHIKRFLRTNRDRSRPLRDELLRAFSTIDFKLMRSWYLHCLLRPV